MANVGTAASGKTLVGAGSGISPTFVDIGTNSGLTEHGVVVSQNNNAFEATPAGSNGQVLIGSTGNNPAFALLDSPDNSITFFTGSNYLGLQVSGSLTSTWENINASQTLEVQHGYFCTANALSLALPATSAVGDVIEVVLRGGTSWTITQAAGQKIYIGNTSTTTGAGGSLASTADGDAIRIVCQTANTTWVTVPGVQGNITVV